MLYSRRLVMAALALAAMGCREKKQSDIASTGQAQVSAAASGAPVATAAGDTIWIGHVASISGNDAAFGQATDKGVKLAITEQNAKNGIKGKKLALKTLDDQGKPEEAAVAASRLITQDHISVLIGEVASSRSLALAPIADSNMVPMISEGSTNPRVTKDNDKTRPYVFRVCYIEPFQGTVMAKFVRENLKLAKVAILRDVGNDYAVGLSQFFKSTFQQLGGEIVIEQSFKTGETDFKAQLTAIKGKNPDLIYLPGYYSEVALIARQARELGIKQPFAGGDGWDSAPLYQIAKGALDGSYFNTHFSRESPSPIVKDFIAKYTQTYGNPPDTLDALGYDAAMVAFDALGRAKELTGPAIREAIEQTKGLDTVTGTITIDADHNPVKSSMVMAIRDNKANYVATVNP